MVKVAVAGATGHVGQCIVESILAAKKHEVVVLSRSASNPLFDKLGVKTVQVSYTDPTSLDRALTGVHTVISAISSLSFDEFVSSQIALLDAAVRAGVKRFTPSEFNLAYLHEKPVYASKATVANAVRNSGLEYTLFQNGIFMNYLANGTPGLGHASSMNIIVNVAEGTANIPGDGNSKIAFTLVEDVGDFIAASLDLEKWPEVSQMVGDVKTYNEVVALAEAVTGKEFRVTYMSLDELKARLDPNPKSPWANFMTEIMIIMAEGGVDYRGLNLNKLCTQVKPTGVKEFLQKWWGGKSQH